MHELWHPDLCMPPRSAVSDHVNAKAVWTGMAICMASASVGHVFVLQRVLMVCLGSGW